MQPDTHPLGFWRGCIVSLPFSLLMWAFLIGLFTGCGADLVADCISACRSRGLAFKAYCVTPDEGVKCECHPRGSK